MSKRTASTAGAVAALAVLLLAGFIISVKTEGAGGTPNPPEQCIHTPHFYANDARAGSNQFGPELKDGSVEAGNARFDLKLRKDAAFAAVWEDVILYDAGKVQSHGDGWYTLRAQQFLNDEDLWCRQIGAIKDAISKTEVQDRSEKYHTFLMVPQGENIPLVRRTDRPVAMGHVLVFLLKNGRTEYARYVCDLQPARPEIPGLPPVSEAPTQPTTPGTTPTTPGRPPRPVCPPQWPHAVWSPTLNKWICKDDPSNDPAPSGNVPTPVQGQAPPVAEPASPPAAGTPPPAYVPPTQPTPTAVPQPSVPPNEGATPSNPVPPDTPTGPVCDPSVCDD